MADLILSVNAGSSSLKICLYRRAPEPTLLLTSSVSNISAPPAKFSFNPISSSSSSSVKDEPIQSITDHASAFSHFLSHLHTSIPAEEIAHVCHRVVHGGDYTDPVIISDETYHHIEKLSDLAPLHNGAALAVIKACIASLPSANSIAYFDTAFHRSIPPHIANYAIDQDVAKKRGLKKYGFHGLSYSSILRSTSSHLSFSPSSLSLIILHLGSGASACAISQGQSLDTSMGLTPLNGLPGATRSGSVDPSLIFHYTNKAGRISHDPALATTLHVTEAERVLNTKAGWKALAGTTDFGVITQKAFAQGEDGGGGENSKERLAFDLFVDRILDFVGAYHLKLGGEVDALVFSGGIGERSVKIREVVGRKVECLGYASVDPEKNAGTDKVGGVVVDIGVHAQGGGDGKKKRVLVCRTDEQLEMARQCALDDKFW